MTKETDGYMRRCARDDTVRPVIAWVWLWNHLRTLQEKPNASR